MAERPLDLTIAIPVRNEERNLAVCLQAIGQGFARQVVVIDSASTDGTPAVARAHGAELIAFDWDGRFPKKRNWYLQHHAPTTRWVLFLDADEILTPEVKREIAESKVDNTRQIIKAQICLIAQEPDEPHIKWFVCNNDGKACVQAPWSPE